MPPIDAFDVRELIVRPVSSQMPLTLGYAQGLLDSTRTLPTLCHGQHARVRAHLARDCRSKTEMAHFEGLSASSMVLKGTAIAAGNSLVRKYYDLLRVCRESVVTRC
jgi:hypothetical protein